MRTDVAEDLVHDVADARSCGEQLRDARRLSTVTPMPRRLAIVAAPLALAALLLSGCSPEPRIPAAEPQPTATPLFATDEEALAAATAAYEEYLAVSANVASSESLDTSPLESLTTPSFLDRELEALAEITRQGLRVEGQAFLSASRLQQRYTDATQREVVIIYGCLDASDTKAVDLDGNDRTPPDRRVMVDLEIELVENDDRGLVINRSDVWAGESVC